MYTKHIRPCAERDDRIVHPWRAQTFKRSDLRAIRMCPRCGQNIFYLFLQPIFYGMTHFMFTHLRHNFPFYPVPFCFNNYPNLEMGPDQRDPAIYPHDGPWPTLTVISITFDIYFAQMMRIWPKNWHFQCNGKQYCCMKLGISMTDVS